MAKSLRVSHSQIARQIKALEREVLAFQPGLVAASGKFGAVDASLAIILSARLSAVWKRVGEAIPSRSG